MQCVNLYYIFVQNKLLEKYSKYEIMSYIFMYLFMITV